MARKKIVAGNWKLNKSGPAAAVELAKAVVAEFGKETAVDVVLCPPFTAIPAVAQVVKGTRVALGAQNCYPEDSGAFTGEIDCGALVELGCQYVIIGHSERRQYFSESNEFINKKVKKALDKGLTPILCVGETLEHRESGQTMDVVKDHVEGGIAGLSSDQVRKIVIAYEPVWAIGTGKTARPEDAQEVHEYIRDLLRQAHDDATAQAVRIQYGGSVKADNAKTLFSQGDIDGGLIGGASLKASDFAEIIKAGRL